MFNVYGMYYEQALESTNYELMYTDEDFGLEGIGASVGNFFKVTLPALLKKLLEMTNNIILSITRSRYKYFTDHELQQFLSSIVALSKGILEGSENRQLVACFVSVNEFVKVTPDAYVNQIAKDVNSDGTMDGEHLIKVMKNLQSAIHSCEAKLNEGDVEKADSAQKFINVLLNALKWLQGYIKSCGVKASKLGNSANNQPQPATT